jgi:hypothetical protein
MKRLLSFLPMRHLFTMMAIIMIVVPFRFVAHAAELEGVVVPDTLQVNGKILYLNGLGRRTYPILGIHIYVASLYLEHFNANTDEIIRSRETKLLTVRFERNVSADDARSAWRQNLDSSCVAPCRLDREDVQRFLSEVPAMHAGDDFHLLFEPNAVTVSLNGKQIGTIRNQQFAEAMLATFIGPNTDLPRLRQELLTHRSFANMNVDSSTQRASLDKSR